MPWHCIVFNMPFLLITGAVFTLRCDCEITVNSILLDRSKLYF